MKRLILLLIAMAVAAANLNAEGYKTDKDILYKAENDEYSAKMCRLDVAYEKGAQRRPVIVWFHGGGLTSGHLSVPETLTRDGAVVVGVGYRFVSEVEIADVLDDAAASVKWVVDNIAKYGGDASRIYLAGHSAGGYIVDMLGLDRRYLAKYGVNADKMAAIVPYSGQVITHFAHRKKNNIPELTPVINEFAPLYFVRGDAAPFLVISGDREMELFGRYEETAYFARMMQLNGHKDITFYELDGFNHRDMVEPAHLILLKYIKERELKAKTEIEKRCKRVEFKDQGQMREIFVYVPETDCSKFSDGRHPLVLVLHGYGGSGAKGKAEFLDLADREGFAVCFPSGAKCPKGKTGWNVGYPVQEGWKQDDEKFVMRLIPFLQKEFGLSSRNVFFSGMSNGGEMCYLMAMHHPEKFNAIASIAGLTLNCMDRKFSSPVPFMEVHGTADKTSMWNGDPENKGGWGAYLSVPDAVAQLRTVNGCSSERIEEMPLIRNKVTKHVYFGGFPAWKGGPEAEVWLYEVENGGHTWSANDMDTYGEIWKFFKKYLK